VEGRKAIKWSGGQQPSKETSNKSKEEGQRGSRKKKKQEKLSQKNGDDLDSREKKTKNNGQGWVAGATCGAGQKGKEKEPRPWARRYGRSDTPPPTWQDRHRQDPKA